MNIHSPVGFILELVAMTTLLVSFAATNWATGNTILGQDYDAEVGLWQVCLKKTECVSIFENNGEIIAVIGGWIKWVQAFSIIALILMIATFSTMVAHLCFSESFLGKLKTNAVCLMLTGITYGLTVLIFWIEARNSGLVGKDSLGYGFCFYFGWITIVTAVIGSLLLNTAANQENSPKAQYMLLK